MWFTIRSRVNIAWYTGDRQAGGRRWLGYIPRPGYEVLLRQLGIPCPSSTDKARWSRPAQCAKLLRYRSNVDSRCHFHYEVRPPMALMCHWVFVPSSLDHFLVPSHTISLTVLIKKKLFTCIVLFYVLSITKTLVFAQRFDSHQLE